MSAKLGRVSLACLHAGSLLLTGWALVATSAPPPGPARDCFTGVPPSAHLLVALAAADHGMSLDAGIADVGEAGAVAGDTGSNAGEASADAGDAGDDGGSSNDASDDASNPGFPYTGRLIDSCRGIDGLVEGVSLVFEVIKGSRPDTEPSCYGYETRGFRGLRDVKINPPSTPGLQGGPSDFTSASGTFSLSGAPECRGNWAIGLHPATDIATGQLVSPLDAGTSPWVVQRSIQIPQGQFCSPVFATRGEVFCQDTFAVQSIVDQGDQ